MKYLSGGILDGDDMVLEEALIGLSDEFHTLVTWLPCGFIKDGKLVIDPILDEISKCMDTRMKKLSDPKVIGITQNHLNGNSGIEYINIARVERSLSTRRSRNIIMAGGRAVYVIVYKLSGSKRESVNFIRFQKRDISYFLDLGMEMKAASEKSRKYRENIILRHEACRKIGLNLMRSW